MKIKYIILASFLLFYGVSFSQTSTKTKLYILGVAHDSSSVLTPQMLFEILENIKPDILLQENDSEQIANYDKVIRSTSNEQTATLRYLKTYPETLNLPFEFEGRNQYRRDNGMVPTDNLTIRLLDSLFQQNLLTDVNMKIFEKYKEATNALINFSKKDIKTLNSIEFEVVNRYRQNLQHHELPKIVNSQEIFANRYVTKPDGSTISYRDGYRLWCNFWDLRNNSMAINIIKKANEFKGKKIAILTGVQHKYYLKELLDKYADGNYELIEYFK